MLAVGFFVLLLGLGGTLIDLMATNPEVRAAGRVYLPVMALIALTGMSAYVYDGVMIGATMTRIMRNGMVISLVGFLVVAAVLEPSLDLWGLWIALHAMLLICGSLCMPCC